MSGELSPALWGCPVVSGSSERAALFPAPPTNQRVHNLSTNALERWNGSAWITELGIPTFDVDSAPFMAVGDGSADDSTAVANAISAAKAVAGKVKFGAKKYRVTSGVAQAVAYQDVVLEGTGSSRESVNDQGTVIILDSTDPASYFYDMAARHHLYVKDITFKCAQYVLDRAFFKFSAINYHHFDNVNFESVERPIVYKTGSYFQNAQFNNVQFRNSGSFHSETTTLVGTLLKLTNVNHDGSTPANTEKILCNLQGVRMIKASNFLLEGSLPSAGWKVLNFDLGASVAGIQAAPGAIIDGLWIEFSGTQPTNTIRASGVNVEITMSGGNLLSTTFGTMLLDKGALVTIRNTPILGASVDFNTVATFNDVYSCLLFDSCQLREIASVANPQVKFDKCTSVRDDASQNVLVRSTTVDSEKLWEWDGGLLRSNKFVTHPSDNSFGNRRSIVVDATYGRIITVNPNGQAQPYWSTVINAPTEWSNMVLRIQLYAKFRSGTGGSFHLIRATGAVSATLVTAVTEEAWAWYHIALRIPAGGGAITIENLCNKAISNDTQIAAFRISLGDGYGRFPSLDKKTTIESEATALPTTGAFALGDRIKNVSGTIAQPKAWTITTAGGFKSTTRANTTAVAQGVWALWDTGTTVWECSIAGTTAGSAPSIVGKNVGDTVVDGTVTWTLMSLTTAVATSEGNL